MQKIIITIDVEAPLGENGAEKLIIGKTKEGIFGIDYLMDVFDKYDMKGLFFVDFAEAFEYGKKEIINIARHIYDRGHNVGVHIHPDRMKDKQRRYLWEYSFEEQFEMIKFCTELYKESLGFYPLSFRAGRYGANDDTIKILEILNYKYDFSYFYNKRNCKITQCKYYNRVTKIGKIIELPVTVYKSFRLFKYERIDKIDISSPYKEFEYMMNIIEKDNSVDIVSYFLHSFSLLKWRKHPDNPALNKREIKKLSKEMKYISTKNVICEEDISNYELNGRENSISINKMFFLSTCFFFFRGFKVLIERKQRNI